MLSWLIDWCLRYRGLVLLASLVLSLAGVYSLFHLDIDAFPDITPVQVQVNVAAPSLGPEEIERQITAPLEQSLAGLPKLTALRSISKFGISQIVLLFDDDTDVYFARQVVSERLRSVVMPPGIESPALGPVSGGLGEVLHYALAFREPIDHLPPDERIRRLTQLHMLHEWVVKPKLKSVRGVAEVTTWGGFAKQIQIRIDPVRLAKYGLTLDQVASVLGRANQNVGGGSVPQNSQMLLVHGIGRVTEAAKLGDLPMNSKSGVPVRLRDVADITVGHEVRRGAVSAEGRGEIVHGIGFMLTGENSHVVTRALTEKLQEVRSSLPPEAELIVLYDRTELVDFVIATVRTNLFEGGLLVVAVLFAFLGNLRAAAIVALAIPLSMLFAFSGMVRFGIAASLLSLGAIDFGMVVDSSVVLVENCVRHIAHGDTRKRVRREVIRDAAVEVRKPTLFGELIVILVYLPVLTLEGTEGKLFRPMALTVVFALLGSLIFSLTLMPVLASIALPRRLIEREPLAMRIAHALHAPILRLCMRHRLAVLAIALCVSFVAFGMIAPSLGTEFVPELSEGAIAIGVTRLAGTDLEESVRINTLMERAVLAEFPDEVNHVWSRVGTADVATDPMGVELTDAFISLKPRSQWKKAKSQAELTRLIEHLLRDYPGQRLAFTQPIAMRIAEMETGVRSEVGVKIFGDDLDILAKKAGEIESVLKLIPGAADVAVEPIAGQPVLQVRVRPDETARYGVSTDAVLDWVRAIGGVPVGELFEGPARVPVVLRLPDNYRTDPESLRRILISTPQGERIPLSRLADVALVEGPSTINREWGQRRVGITANVRGRDEGSFVSDGRAAVASQVGMPSARYSVTWEGQFENYNRARVRLLIVVPIAIFAIFALLCLTYRNGIDALRVLTGIPFGFVGGVFALWLRGLPFSISAAVGFIALAGVAVLDDMILISYVRQLRRTGLSVDESVRQAAITRLRPVLMTTLVAALGFLPMALSDGVGAEVQRPLATVVIGGVIGAMVMSLLVLRVLYLVFDQFAHILHRIGLTMGVSDSWLGSILGISETVRPASPESLGVV